MAQLITFTLCVAVVMFWCGVTCAPIFNDSVSKDTFVSMRHMEANGCVLQEKNLICKNLDEKIASKIFVEREMRMDVLWLCLTCGLFYLVWGKFKVFFETAAHVKNVTLPAFENISKVCVSTEKKVTEEVLPQFKVFSETAAHVKNVTLPAFENISKVCVSTEKKVTEEVLPQFKAASEALVAGSNSLNEALTFARQVVSGRFQYNIVTGKGKVTMPDLE